MFLAGCGRQGAVEFVGIHRLTGVPVEAGFRRPLTILRLPVTRDRDETDNLAPGHRANPPSDLTAIEARKPEVHERDVRLPLAGDGDGLEAVTDGGHVVPGELEQGLQALARVPVVLDD